MTVQHHRFASRFGLITGIAGALVGQVLLFDAGDVHASPANSSSSDFRYKAPKRVTVASNVNQPSESGLSLAVGLTLNGDGSTCGTGTAVTANVGDSIDFCYTVTNQSATALAFSTLDDSVDGNVFGNKPTAIAANGGTYVYHRSVVATATHTYEATWKAQDVLPGYTYDDSQPTAFVDISATGTALDPGDDDTAGVTIPFAFSFYGASSDQLCIGNNGAVVFGASTCTVDYNNTALPAAPDGLSGAAIAPFWTDFSADSGNVYWAADGAAPNRRIIVQWNRPHYGDNGSTPSSANLEAILNESGSVEFQYQSTDFGAPGIDNGVGATIGLQNADQSMVSQYSFDTALPHPAPSSIHWVFGTAPPVVLTATASASLDVGAPVIGVTPASIERNAPSGSSAPIVADLALANTGSRTLTWGMAEAPLNARAHFPRIPRRIAREIITSASVLKTRQADAKAMAKRRSLATRPSNNPLGSAVVPAYTFTGFGRLDYVSMDLTLPGALNPIVNPSAVDVSAASFVNNDFSKQYVITGAMQFGTVDTITGAFTEIGPVAGPANATYLSLCWDAFSGKLYALADFGATQALYTIDPATGAAVLVGPISGASAASAGLVSIAISPEGLMYGLDIVEDALVAIDKTNGDTAAIGPTGIDANYQQSIGFDPSTGVLYWAAFQDGAVSEIYTINPLSGVAARVGPVPDHAELIGLAIALPSKGCSLPGDVPWLSVASTGGTVEAGAAADTVAITLNPTGLADGNYTASLCVASNDPVHGLVAVPVALTVGSAAPTASVDQTPLEFSLETGQAASRTLSLNNTGGPGSRLTYTLTEAETDCAAPSDVAWLDAAPPQGEVTTTRPAVLQTVVHTTSLAIGSYSAKLCLTTNDAARTTLSIPVTLMVKPVDSIFRSGFDREIFDSGLLDLNVPENLNGLTVTWANGSICGARVCDGNLNFYDNNFSLHLNWVHYDNGIDGGVASVDGQYSVLASGDIVGPGSHFISTNAADNTDNLIAGVDGFLGFRFACQGPASGICYGYAHLRTTAPYGFPFTLVRYWYDKTGAAIAIP